MNLSTTSSPHVKGKNSTARIMRDVVIALLPALIVGVVVHGPRALVITLISIAACLVAEGLVNAVFHRPNTLHDGSAVVTGMLLAMTLPASVELWLPAVGGFFAMIVVKGFFGGLGQNIFNPALAARAFLLLLWPTQMVRYAALGENLPLVSSAADVVSSATPLHHMQIPALPETSILNMFLGNMAGSIGEISALAILIGGVYLLARRVISIRIPAAYLGTVAVVTFVFSNGQPHLSWVLANLFGGGLMLAAFFMATDYATSPVTPVGQVAYGIGCGLLTVLFRRFGLFPEGVTYAILLMNAAVWLLDQLTVPRRFGAVKGGAAK